MDHKTKELSTGEIHKKYGITLKTLRYYESIGLLRPTTRNDQTGYRFYNSDDISKLLAIKYFQDSGMALTKIKKFFEYGNLTEISAFFYETISEKTREIRDAEIAKDNLLAWHQLVEEGKRYIDQKKIPFEIKKVREIYTISKCIMTNGSDIENTKDNNSLRPDAMAMGIITYGPSYLEFGNYAKRIDNANQTVFRHMEINPRCTLPLSHSSLGGYSVASAIHIGPRETISKTYRKLLKWTEQQRLTLSGSAIERIIIDIQTVSDVNQHVTEIMLPLKE